MADPANLFHKEIIDNMNCYLNDGWTVSVSGDFDERLQQRERIKSLDTGVRTYILGSSHIMYIPWSYSDSYCAGVSGAVLEDVIAIYGMIEDHDQSIDRIILCVDPWMFLDQTEEERYKSIEEEYQKELAKITNLDIGNNGASHFYTSMSRVFELFSPAYFQSSVSAVLRHRVNRTVLICSDDSIENKAKITPNGRRIPAETYFKTDTESLANARKRLAADDVYLLKRNSSLSEYRMNLFEQFVNYILEENVEVMLYLPAWYSAYYQAFCSDISYKYVLDVENYILDFADNAGIKVHGSYDPVLSGTDDDDFMDDLHLKPEAGLEQYEGIIR